MNRGEFNRMYRRQLFIPAYFVVTSKKNRRSLIRCTRRDSGIPFPQGTLKVKRLENPNRLKVVGSKKTKGPKSG